MLGCSNKREVSEEECQAMTALFDEATTIATEKQAALSAALEAAMAAPLAVTDAACTALWTYLRDTTVIQLIL